MCEKELNSKDFTAYENRKTEARVRLLHDFYVTGIRTTDGSGPKHLKDTGFHVYVDIPKLLFDSRNGQMKKLQKAREKGFITYFSKAQPDKLYVVGKCIAPGEPIE